MTDAVPIRAHATSTVLRALLEGTEAAEIPLGDMVRALGGRGFGILLVLFGMLNLIPAPLPGLSTVLGAPLLFLSWQLVSGAERPWFPRALAGKTVSRAQLERLAGAARRGRPIERLFRQRLTALVHARAIGSVCLLLSLVIVLPIPLGNWPPAVAVTIYGLALARRDGAAVLLATLAAAIAVGLVATVLFAAGHTIGHVLGE